MMMKKSILLVLCMSALMLVLAGCAAGNVNTMKSTPSPAATFTPAAATMAPVTTMAPSSSAAPAAERMMEGEGNANDGASGMSGAANGAAGMASMTPAQAGQMAEKIAEAVERISEVDDAEVVMRDQRVLVAVEFDDQYSAGLDDRMKKLITETVKKVDEKITEVSITDDSTLYGQVKSLAERISKATGFDELADDIGDLWDRVTGR